MSVMKRGDALLILSALTLSLCLVLFKYSPTESKTARVYENGELTHVIKLDEVTQKQEIEINGGILTVENGAVYYSYSNCPDKLCQKFGKLTSNGDVASCVPNKTVVTVSCGEDENEPDIITY